MRCCLFLLALSLSYAQTTKELDVAGDQKWVDTGVDLTAGATVLITASGSLQFPLANAAGAEGVARGWRDLLRILPVNDAGRGALVGRIGTDASAFLIGPRREMKGVRAGRLFVGINTQGNDTAQGSLHVKIEITAAAAVTQAAAQPEVRVPEFPQDMLDKIPTRITDKDGNLGDRINFAIVGPEARMKEAFQQAGWVIVDRSAKDAVLHGLLTSISKQGYVTLPMSELYFFGRVQDYGYAHAEPISVVAQRHHLRLWKAPFELEGQTVWVGSATHDIGFEKDKRNNGITHKIDPEVDKERDYLVQTLTETGIVVKTAKLTPTTPIKEAKTATGGSFRSDGATHIMYVSGQSALDYSASFADLFCSVFQQENPDTGEWGPCGQYIESPGKTDSALGAIGDKYRLLIVPGIMNTCASDAPAFIEGQTHLREKHGITVELLSVPNDSSEANAKQIAAYIQEHSKDDKRKYIVVGYSKGAPDLQVMLATEKDTVPMVAAFVTVAGAVGGSPIADILPIQADRWIKQFAFGGCKGDLSIGFKSLQKGVRQAFLLSYPDPLVPTYSIAAVSDKTNTSKMLLQNWTLLNAFGGAQDSQLTKSDSVVPGAKYLGVAKADHFAVGLPLEKLQNGALKSFLDHGHYPRGALLEAVLRFVTQDLEKEK